MAAGDAALAAVAEAVPGRVEVSTADAADHAKLTEALSGQIDQGRDQRPYVG